MVVKQRLNELSTQKNRREKKPSPMGRIIETKDSRRDNANRLDDSCAIIHNLNEAEVL